MKDNPKNIPGLLVLLRHGQSEWNRKNIFSGWSDVDLSDTGKEEIRSAARLLKERGFTFDVAFTSVLKRAIRTVWIVLDELDLMWIPVHRDWRLNERHYGILQGRNKAETAQKYGEEQVNIWRRAYDIRPPALDASDPRHPSHDPRYRQLLPGQLPSSECLKDTLARLLPCWNERMAPELLRGQSVLVGAHGNTLRALVKYLDDISDAKIEEMNIPTGVPLVYELDEALHPNRHYYLGDAAQIEKAIQDVANEASVKKNNVS